jgi:large subunit ribosomal protein L2
VTLILKEIKKMCGVELKKFSMIPNRNANIALVLYEDGNRRYIIAPSGLKQGQKIIASDSAPHEVSVMHFLWLKFLSGTQVHNVEIRPGKGGQIVRGAGSFAVVQGKEEELYAWSNYRQVQIKRFKPDAWATIGQVGNPELRSHKESKMQARKEERGLDRPSGELLNILVLTRTVEGKDEVGLA